MSRKIVLVVDDDEDNREWAQLVHLGKPVLTVCEKKAWNTIINKAEHLFAVLMAVKDYQRGLALAILAIEARAHSVGVISESTPDVLDATSFSINGGLITLGKGDGFLLADGIRDWVSFFESITSKRPIIISSTVRGS